MYIKELIIEEFAGVCNVKLAFDRAFNLIVGENETGKSTVCAFIKFMLYGFTDSKEKARLSSLKTGSSSGAMIIEHDGKAYRITRRVSGRINAVSVYDESDGSEFSDWKTNAESVGEYFMGIPAALYTRSVYVSQAEGSHLDGGSAEAISNLLLTGDEALNLKRARKNLDEARKALKLKRGVGGLINDCEQTLSELKAERAAAIEARRKAEATTIALQNEKKKVSALSAELRHVKECLEDLKIKKLFTYIRQLDDLTDQQNKITVLTDDLKSSNTYNGFFPNDDYENELISLAKEISVHTEQIKKTERHLAAIQEKLHTVPPKEYNSYCALGKKEKIIPVYTRNASAFRFFNITFFVCIFLCLISAVSLGLEHMNLLSNAGLFIRVLLGISAVGVISCGIARLFPKKTVLYYNTALFADKHRTVSDICRECESYENKINSSDISYFEKLLKENTSDIESINQRLSASLSRWNKPNAQKAIADYRELRTRLSALTQEKIKNETGISVLSAYISNYSKEETARAKALPANTVFPDSTVSEDDLQKLTSSLEISKKLCAEYELTLAGTASKTDIDGISEKIEATEKQLIDYANKYEAITLALEALDTAQINIRKTVSPYLSEHSSKFFARITDGKYSSLRIDPEINLSYISAENESVTDSLYFSAGSADLAFICLRLALHKRLSENTCIPIILDEALVYFDDNRLALILNELSKISENGVQIILFSASTREAALLSEKANCIMLAQKR